MGGTKIFYRGKECLCEIMIKVFCILATIALVSCDEKLTFPPSTIKNNDVETGR